MAFELDTTGVEAMVRDLAVFAGHGSNTEQALYTVTGKILETAISYTPISTEGELVAREAAYSGRLLARYDLVGGEGVLTTNQGIRGNLPAGTQWTRDISTDYRVRKGVPGKGGQTVNYIMRGGSPRRWSNARWAQYQATAALHAADLKVSVAFAKKRVKQSVGLTRQGWVQIADRLKIPLNITRLEKIRAAVSGDGIAYQDGRGWPEISAEGVYLVIENAFPFERADGAGILQRAIDTGLSAFQTEVKKGVVDDLEKLARRYKGLDILRN